MSTENDYNTQRKKLPLPEYGRNIQKMVDYLFTVEDRDKRNKSAQVVIDVMGNLNPHLLNISTNFGIIWQSCPISNSISIIHTIPLPPIF